MEANTKIQKTNDVYLHNVLEEIVIEQVRLMLEKKYDNLCRCEACIYNISAIVLNNLNPYYITSKQDELIGRAEKYNLVESIEITVKVIHAIESIKNNKTHA